MAAVSPEVSCLDGSVEVGFRGAVAGTLLGTFFGKELIDANRGLIDPPPPPPSQGPPDSSSSSSSSSASSSSTSSGKGAGGSRIGVMGFLQSRARKTGLRMKETAVGIWNKQPVRLARCAGKCAACGGVWSFVGAFLGCTLSRLGVPFPFDAIVAGGTAGLYVSRVILKQQLPFVGYFALGSAAFSVFSHANSYLEREKAKPGGTSRKTPTVAAAPSKALSKEQM
uniref:Uncharacterized protein n=1 Tax=Chromera velia CCMP2878 TaxID=1169474 RepID=A0A0G4FLE3_9ALVE|eukprot:Cvel_17630.t1-p1 / transcript=Cvel_17630.t1 / gene=Cvel_17630 / organism=Chromera_velia_CCMP2878 / gene_product=hypothetical protein / transcript_product=hypothetical protein / location=Cvel_scaffold1419:9016-11270(+) / protein_length=224 / sequence_SO=supercontig / SO=protein_coding / is_pseudo=false